MEPGGNIIASAGYLPAALRELIEARKDSDSAVEFNYSKFPYR
jgi:TPP-dependent trihydroxycyclohexane-1,2-dione (THcHDO) dehydratase